MQVLLWKEAMALAITVLSEKAVKKIVLALMRNKQISVMADCE